jgi:acetyl-CoA acetyltransferase
MNQVAITSADRTPFGRFGGALRELSPVDLVAVSVGDSVARSDISARRVKANGCATIVEAM